MAPKSMLPAIQTQIKEEEDGNLVEFKTDAQISRILIWRAVVESLGACDAFSRYSTWFKIKHRLKAKIVAPPPSTGVEENVEAISQPLLEPSPDRTSAGRTRHPWTVRVEVNEDLATTGVQRVFEDPYAGSFMWIPPGEISIWVPYAEEQRVVKVTQGFWMGKYPVTQEVYEAVMGMNPSSAENPSERYEDNLPVNNVSWLDAVSFCKALTILARNGNILQKNSEYRLPTEVEWEYACRAGSTTRYYFGDDSNELHLHGWFKSNSQKRIHPVGLKASNPWVCMTFMGMYGVGW